MAEPADKPGSVLDSHSSRRNVTVTLKQPTRTRRGPRHEVPIWSCSRWGLPCRSVARLAVRSYRTISPLPRIPENRSAVSFCCTFRRLAPPRRYLAPCPVEPGLSSAFLRMTRLSGRLRRGHCRMHVRDRDCRHGGWFSHRCCSLGGLFPLFRPASHFGFSRLASNPILRQYQLIMEISPHQESREDRQAHQERGVVTRTHAQCRSWDK